MHFAYPPRKDSHPPPFRPRSSKLPFLRRSRLRTVSLVLLGVLGFIWLLSGSKGPGKYHERQPSGNPPAVIVTVVDPSEYSNEYLNTVIENREKYAKKHGYETFIAKSHDYVTAGAPQSWTKIMALRHALSKYPDAKWMWYLDQNAYIMDFSRSLESHILGQKTLEGLMIRDKPIVPPDSIIKTFTHLSGQDVGVVISQDNDGLVSDSLMLRNGDWAKFVTETWLDPLYRSYNFQKAERHALEHIVQWHPTILSKIALIPQRSMASYNRKNLGAGFQDGDFVVMFPSCAAKGSKSCETESQPYLEKWQSS